ncbi:unnamed protein product [Rotaria sordida]|uniref:Uncharacterized protein n=1 Tax=Rotaria sordida TaxID=392033 RepID=A0A818XUG9_9BILA|nr:unnamed protein product [Rotaria sordida]
MQTISWLLNIVACIVCMFIQTSMIIPALVINCIRRATIVGGSQAFSFPSAYIGTLTGVMWTLVGVIATVQYGLVQLTDDITHVDDYIITCDINVMSFNSIMVEIHERIDK